MSDDLEDVFDIAGKTLADKYAIERVIARGGFGTVYKAHHTELDSAVAVKVLMVPDRYQGDLRLQFLEKFKLEARTMAALNHSSIVRVIDYGSAVFANGEAPWMALEWLEGTTLEADLEARRGAGGRSPKDALALLRPAFEALACAHDAGIAHRDIKPANMMLVRARRGEAALRMLDFGIAKVMSADEHAGSGMTATQNELPAFSLLYAAGEQIGRGRTGPWTDVHALALVLTEVLTDGAPYRADNATQIVGAIVDRDRPTPGRYGAKVGPWEDISKKALSIRPADRHANAGELLAALEATVDDAQRAWEGTPVTPPPVVAEAARSVPAVTAPVDTLTTRAGAIAQIEPRSKRWLPVAGVIALSALAVFTWSATRAAPDRQAAAPRVTPSPHPAVSQAPPPSPPAIETPRSGAALPAASTPAPSLAGDRDARGQAAPRLAHHHPRGAQPDAGVHQVPAVTSNGRLAVE